MIQGASPRRGFTLLEVMLALGVGVLLLSALYVAVSAQMRYTSAGRDVIQGSTVARSVFERMTSDILPNLGAVDPSRSSSSNSSQSSSGQSAPAAGSGGSAAGGASSGSSGAGGSGGTSPSSAPATSSGVNSVLTFNMGVQGDSTHLSVFVSRWPREIYQGMTGVSDSSAPPTVSDLRRITYWLSGGGDSLGGLARQEFLQATSDDALDNSSPADDPKLVFAPQVRSVTFQYLDGQTLSWTDSWDGTATSSDGTTPMGPPAAIAISLDIAMPHTGANQITGKADVKTFRHVVVLQTANGPPASSGGGASP
ncbi:MAG: prepilin-type N-terminal cleavage/methylation domain-containing protein [Gemmataceae bacterium]